MKDYGKAVRRALGEVGWEKLRQGRGSHEVWWNPSTAKRTTVPTKIYVRHTANEILKEAGLQKRF